AVRAWQEGGRLHGQGQEAEDQDRAFGDVLHGARARTQGREAEVQAQGQEARTLARPGQPGRRRDHAVRTEQEALVAGKYLTKWRPPSRGRHSLCVEARSGAGAGNRARGYPWL